MYRTTLSKPIIFIAALFAGILFFLQASAAAAISPEALPSAVVENSDTEIVKVEADDYDNIEDFADDFFPEVFIDSDDEANFTIGGLHLQAGQIINFAESLSSDILAAGESVNVTAPVKGDIFAAGNTVSIDAPVSGSVRVAGNVVKINADVDRNLLVFANTVIIAEGVTIHGHANIYGSTVINNGTVMKSVSIGAENAVVNGPIGKNADIEADKVEFGAAAELGGATEVIAPQNPVVAASVVGAENITYTKTTATVVNKTSRKKPKKSGVYKMFRNWIGSYLALGIIGIIFVLIWPKHLGQAGETMVTDPGMSWLKGALFLFATPIAATFFFITIIGIPFALLLWFLYGIGLAAGCMIAGIMLGQHMFTEEKFADVRTRTFLSFLIGYLIVTFIWFIPFLGWLGGLALSVWGIGALLVMIFKKSSQKKSEPAVKTAEQKTDTKKKPAKKKPASKTNTKTESKELKRPKPKSTKK